MAFECWRSWENCVAAHNIHIAARLLAKRGTRENGCRNHDTK